jgi:DNA-binding LytR/AlgR family response regulator
MIIEDEPIAADIVRSYIEQVQFLSLESVHSNALSALQDLNEKNVDVLFLDIHLPKLKGMDFLKSLAAPPKVIITSAYKEYALEGFELEITDYLLKPFSFPRFLKAVNRLDRQPRGAEHNTVEPEHIFFNVNKKMVKVYLDEILYIESLKEYVKIHLKDRFIITKFQIGELEKLLSHSDFLRVHRSFVVARNKISSFSAHVIEIQGKHVPIGRSFMGMVRERIQRR